MKRVKRIFALIVLTTICLNLYAFEPPSKSEAKFASRFLIVVDSESYNSAKSEILAYKSVLESEGLGVEILAGDWKSPEVLREEIKKIYNRKPALEGAVFIGKVPVVRVQNFQHATTAFKMDEEKFPIEDASVTSDRFYDDLDLEFEFIQNDKSNPNIFYYKLKESSPQKIESDFYTARMLPPSDYGKESGQMLREYLQKVVIAHKNETKAQLLKVFNGHGYNSDCLTVWQDQQYEMKEQFPLAFKSSIGNRFYNFRQSPFMRDNIYELLERDAADIFIFHEHGDFDTQYINGEFPAGNILSLKLNENPNTIYSKDSQNFGPMEALIVSLRNSYRKYSGKRREDFKEIVIKEFGFNESVFNQKTLDSLKYSDSLFAASINIKLPDLKSLKPQAKFVMFDACYNGSFHRQGYVAGYYIFGNGSTITTQGNTVNVLQDKWSTELIGMIGAGARIGFWQKEIQPLESHLVGDPTLRFTNSEGLSNRNSLQSKLNYNLAVNSKNQKVWEEYLKTDNPILQAVAIKKLSALNLPEFSTRLLEIFKNSKFNSVRMEALKRLFDYSDENMVIAISLGIEDSFELIRRNSARFAGYSGDPRLIKPLVKTMLFSGESQRVQYAAQNSVLMFNISDVIKELSVQISASNLINGAQIESDIKKFLLSEQKRQDKALATILNKEAKLEDRISAIRNLRNYNNHKQVDQLLGVLANKSDDLKTRITLAEALGWFNLSINKEKIIASMESIARDSSENEFLKKEIIQSLLRLK